MTLWSNPIFKNFPFHDFFPDPLSTSSLLSFLSLSFSPCLSPSLSPFLYYLLTIYHIVSCMYIFMSHINSCEQGLFLLPLFIPALFTPPPTSHTVNIVNTYKKRFKDQSQFISSNLNGLHHSRKSNHCALQDTLHLNHSYFSCPSLVNLMEWVRLKKLWWGLEISHLSFPWNCKTSRRMGQMLQEQISARLEVAPGSILKPMGETLLHHPRRLKSFANQQRTLRDVYTCCPYSNLQNYLYLPFWICIISPPRRVPEGTPSN